MRRTPRLRGWTVVYLVMMAAALASAGYPNSVRGAALGDVYRVAAAASVPALLSLLVVRNARYRAGVVGLVTGVIMWRIVGFVQLSPTVGDFIRDGARTGVALWSGLLIGLIGLVSIDAERPLRHKRSEGE